MKNTHWIFALCLLLASSHLEAASTVCFSPEEACDEKLVELIRSAKKSIDVAVFDLNLDQVAHHLLVQSKKIPVRILVDRRQSRGQHSLIPMMIKAGARIRTGRQRGIMHHKFVIVDGSRLATGSFNFTHGGANLNQENQVYLDEPALVSRFHARFEKSWSEAFEPGISARGTSKRAQGNWRSRPRKSD